MQVLKILSEAAADAFEKCGYERELGQITVSNRPDLCQFQCNGAMQGAKRYKKAPMQIAGEVADLLKNDKRLSAAEPVSPGFINISLADDYIAELIDAIADGSPALPPQTERKTIVIDYGGPNVAKPLHVGHLRTAIIGEALYRLSKALGHNVIGDIHLGDWGLQMGLVITETKRRKPGLCYFDPDYTGEYPSESPLSAEELNEIYPEASKRAKTDADFANKAAQATVELQQGTNRGYHAFWKQVRDISIQDAKRNYEALNVHFDYWYGESDAEPYIPRVMEILNKRGLLKESDGAMIVDVSKPDDTEPMPPIIISKSNGGDVYGTTDLGTLLQRTEDWNPDEIWYVVDSRQSLHFKQVFRCASLAGIIPGHVICRHISYGTINGKDGKPFKTREGGVMRLSDVVDSVITNAYARVNESGLVCDEDNKMKVARMVGVAALKICDLMNHRVKDYVFDLDRSLSTEGKTGPYLQYTAVRIRSLLKKAQSEKLSGGRIQKPESAVERELMLALATLPEALPRAFAEKTPNIICDALFNIAGIFNKFYSENKILSCPDAKRRSSWIKLLGLTFRFLCDFLDILGIEIPEQM